MKKLLVSASILMASMSSFAAFTSGMTPTQVETEARAAVARGENSAAILAAASAQGLSVPTVAAALIGAGRDASAVTSAAVAIAPNQAQAIVNAAATVSPAQAQTILNAAVAVLPAQATSLQAAVLSAPNVAPGSVTAPTAAGAPLVHQVAQAPAAPIFNGAPTPRPAGNSSTGSGNSVSRR